MIDLSFLTDAMDGNVVLAQKFLGIFKSQAPKQMEELKSQLAQQDWEAVSTTAHSLKTQFAYLNLTQLSTQMEVIEQLADNQQTATIYSLVEEANHNFLEILRTELLA
ncbi:Hpt domain-containing protein [Rhodocytophaga aerolata]|uniref:Hpt domain-containing protein n=1 Tax=Rhodocytophaga aerolata TaxID=455078 RepID=A0ABT8RHP7_9BACT|nr:Hpt domain-containing protein [Rhodocytophaga aerolata]MDO1451610.1 Hpt domain-containing protein [Rhodocytophaga aerolata]